MTKCFIVAQPIAVHMQSTFVILGEKMKTIEIRWHGRGGQGAKTASLLLADVAFMSGLQVQGFPEYGPERMGAPITAYNRLSTEELLVHSNIACPDYVVVVDETLLHGVDVTSGLSTDGAILVNSASSPEQITKKLNGYKGKVYTVDANRIALESIGKQIPNTVLLASLVKIANIMPADDFFSNMKGSFKHKFSAKPAVIAGNINAIERGYKEVIG